MEYEKIIVHWVFRLSFLMRKDISDRMRAAGHRVTPEEWALLMILSQGDSRTPSDIADITSKDPTTVTRLIDGMVAKGLASRTEDPADRRRSLIQITPEGQTFFGQLEPIAQSLITDAMGGIDPQDAQIAMGVLRQMTSNMLGARSR